MATVEQRLSALEKRAAAQREQIQALFGDTKALSIIAEAIGAAVAADNKALLRTIILNLRQYEKFGRDLNEHDLTIARLRSTREFFEGRLDKATGGAPHPSSGGAHRRRK